MRRKTNNSPSRIKCVSLAIAHLDIFIVGILEIFILIVFFD